MGNSGQHTDTDTDTTARIFTAINQLIDRVSYLEIGDRMRNEEITEIKTKNMYLENVVLSIWDATMSPKPKPKTKPKKKK